MDSEKFWKEIQIKIVVLYLKLRMMKKIFIISCLLTASVVTFSQSCEERETKLLGSTGASLAGMLYNTYVLIGSICDGYKNNNNTVAKVNNLMNTQKKLIENLIKIMEELGNENILKAQSDKDFAATVIQLLKGLEKQAQLLLDYTTTKSKDTLDGFDEQGKQNWSAISVLMGIK